MPISLFLIYGFLSYPSFVVFVKGFFDLKSLAVFAAGAVGVLPLLRGVAQLDTPADGLYQADPGL